LPLTLFGLCKWLVHEVLMNVSLCCNPHFKAFAHLLFLVHRAREHAPSSSSYYLFLLSFGSLSFKSCENFLSFDYVCNCDQTCLKNKQTNKQKSLDDECARSSSQNAQIVFFFLMWMVEVWFWLWCNNGNFCSWISIKKEKVCGSWWFFFSNLTDLHRLMFLLILRLWRSQLIILKLDHNPTTSFHNFKPLNPIHVLGKK
jgi:hypothetical protein